MGQVAVAARTEVARPLKVLVPLIKDELEAGDSAGIEHYRRAGEMLIEAKEQLAHGEWSGWIERNFHLSDRSARRYMQLVEVPETDARVRFNSMRDALRGTSGNTGTGKVSWQQPVQEILSRVDVEALAREQQNLKREEQMLHKLGHQLIDAGFKALASKLHPDKVGGSSEAMARLNKVRSILREAI